MKIESNIILKKYATFDEVNQPKFKALLENAFGKVLIKDYFSYAMPSTIIIMKEVKKDGEEYLGAIVAETIGNDVHYLDKIAIAKNHQGNGIGKKLWEHFAARSQKMVWRAKENNPINDFYLKNCEGLQKVHGWIIYWKGLTSTELREAIAYAVAKKATFEE